LLPFANGARAAQLVTTQTFSETLVPGQDCRALGAVGGPRFVVRPNNLTALSVVLHQTFHGQVRRGAVRRGAAV
jgi:hypothetical protein